MRFTYLVLAIVVFAFVRATFRCVADIPEPNIIVSAYDLLNALGGIILWKLSVKAISGHD